MWRGKRGEDHARAEVYGKSRKLDVKMFELVLLEHE